MTAEQWVTVKLELLGGPKFAAQIMGASKGMVAFARSTKVANAEQLVATKRSFLHNQALYTLRRGAYFATLAFVGLAAAAAKWGISYLSALQNARVALSPVIKNQALLNNYLNQLFNISKFSPFVIKDIASAFRVMYATMSHVGVSAHTVLTTIRSLTNYLSYTGKTSPGDLNKVTQALSKMANLGRLTGQVVRSLGSVGIPIFAILSKYFHVSRDQLANISKLNLSPNSVLAAIIGYSKTPGIRNAALRNAFGTFSGTIGVLRDTISQISGHLLQGSFGGSQGWLFNLVKPGGALAKISNIRTGKGTIFGLSKMLTGGTFAGTGFLLILKTIKDLATTFVKVLIPAFIMGAAVLAPFLIVVKAIDIILVQMNKHATIMRYILAPVIAGFIAWKAAVVTVGIAMKIASGWMVIWDLLMVKQPKANSAALASLKWYERGIIAVRNAIVGVDLATLGWIGLIIAIGAAIVYLYFKWKPFHDLVNNTWRAFTSGAPAVRLALTLAFGPLGLALQELVLIHKYWKDLQGVGHSITSVLPSTHSGSKGWAHQLFNPFNLPLGFAEGGITPRSGSFMVGERGPELVNLPQGSKIIPNHQLASGVNLSTVGGSTDERPIVVQVMLDRKVLAEGVARARQDKLARR